MLRQPLAAVFSDLRLAVAAPIGRPAPQRSGLPAGVSATGLGSSIVKEFVEKLQDARGSDFFIFRAVPDCNDYNSLASDAVENDVRRPSNHQLSNAGYGASTA